MNPSSSAPLGIATFIGSTAVVGSVMVAAALPADAAAARLAVVALALFAVAVSTPDALAVLVVAGVAALLVNGFLVDRFGELAWHGQPDLVRLAALGVAAALGLTVGVVRARLAQHRRFALLESYANCVADPASSSGRAFAPGGAGTDPLRPAVGR